MFLFPSGLLLGGNFTSDGLPASGTRSRPCWATWSAACPSPASRCTRPTCKTAPNAPCAADALPERAGSRVRGRPALATAAARPSTRTSTARCVPEEPLLVLQGHRGRARRRHRHQRREPGRQRSRGDAASSTTTTARRRRGRCKKSVGARAGRHQLVAAFAQTQQSPYRYDKDRGYVCTFSALVLKGTHRAPVPRRRHAHLPAAGRRARAADGGPPRHGCRRTRATSAARWASTRRSRSTTTRVADRARRRLRAGHRRRLRARRRRPFVARAIRERARRPRRRGARHLVEEAYRARQRRQPDRADRARRRAAASRALASCASSLRGSRLPPLARGARRVRRLPHRARAARQPPQPRLPGVRRRDRRARGPQDARRSTCRATPTYLERFLMEEWIARRIDSPHVLKPCRAHARAPLPLRRDGVRRRPDAGAVDGRPPAARRSRPCAASSSRSRAACRRFHRLEMLHQDLRPRERHDRRDRHREDHRLRRRRSVAGIDETARAPRRALAHPRHAAVHRAGVLRRRAGQRALGPVLAGRDRLPDAYRGGCRTARGPRECGRARPSASCAMRRCSTSSATSRPGSTRRCARRCIPSRSSATRRCRSSSTTCATPTQSCCARRRCRAQSAAVLEDRVCRARPSAVPGASAALLG